MLLVGLTGGIASGKSLVARVLRDLGAHLIDADRIVHDLLEPGRQAWQEVVDHFGPDIVLPQGTIDRRRLGSIVFHDPGQRAWLNSTLHPKVFEVYHAQVRHIRERTPDAVIVLDAALLIETGFHRNMDRTIVVYAEPEQQLARLKLRDHFTDEEALTRIQCQLPLSEKRGQADYVIDNTGSRERTEEQTRTLYARLVQEEKAL